MELSKNSSTKATRTNPQKDVNKILIANLGAAKYRDTTYCYAEDMNELSTTGYTFDAVVKYENPNKLILIGTARSYWDFVVDWYSTNDGEKLSDCNDSKQLSCRGEDPEVSENEETHYDEVKKLVYKKEDSKITEKYGNREKGYIYYQPIKINNEELEKVQKYISRMGNFEQVKIVIVSNGVSKEEQEMYFENLRTAIEEVSENTGDKKTEIIYDVSNGFRSMPLYIMMLVRYLSLLKKHDFSFKAYYGNYEVRTEYEGYSPLVNLTIVPILTDWINALHDFLQYGSVKTLCRCLEAEKVSGTDDYSNRINREINEIISEFDNFEYAVNSNNLYYLIRGIVYITGKTELALGGEKFAVLHIDNSYLSKQAQFMLEEIRKSYIERFYCDAMITAKWSATEAYILEKIAELYISFGNYGDAAIAFQEGMLTFVMEKYLRNYLQTTGNLNTEQEFYEFIHEFANRNEVVNYYYERINKDGYQKTEFDSLYMDIKNRIRNTNAHFRYDEEIATVSEMEGWLRKATGMMLAEISPENGLTGKTGLEKIYANYVSERQDSARKTLWEAVFIRDDSGRFSLKSDFKGVLSKPKVKESIALLQLSPCSFSAWREEIDDCRKKQIVFSEFQNADEELAKLGYKFADKTYGEWVKGRHKKKEKTGMENYVIAEYLHNLHENESAKRRVLEVSYLRNDVD